MKKINSFNDDNNFQKIAAISMIATILLMSFFFVFRVHAQEPKYGGTFIGSVGVDPPFLTPALSTHAPTSFKDMYNELISYDQDGNLIPSLAKSWTVSDDGLTVTMNLEENVFWHDGEPFTSADVKYSFEEVLAVHHPMGKVRLAALDVVETPDDHTVVFKLKYQTAPIMSYWYLWHSCVLPKHIYEGTDILENPANWAPIGTGPFKFVEYVKGSHIEMERNDNYWKEGLPYLDRIIWRIIPDATARVLALEAGEIDYVSYSGFPNAEVERLEQVEGINVYHKMWGPASLVRIHCNVRNAPLDNVKVRQALSAAIDKQVLVDLAYFGLAQPATGPITTVTGWAYNADAVSPRYNVEYANQLLDAAGYPRGTDGNRFTLRMTYIATFPQDVTDAEIIKEQMKDVGIELEMIPLEYNTFKENVYVDWNFDLAIKDLAAAPDPSISVARVYITSNIKKKAFTNCNGYSNSTVDALWDQIEKEMDREKRAQLLYEVQEILVYEMPEIWLVEKEGVVAYNDEFEGLIGGTWWMGSEPNDSAYWTLGEAPPAQSIISTEIAIVIVVVIVVAVALVLILRRRK